MTNITCYCVYNVCPNTFCRTRKIRLKLTGSMYYNVTITIMVIHSELYKLSMVDFHELLRPN